MCVTYGSSQARGGIGVAAASLHHSPSKTPGPFSNFHSRWTLPSPAISFPTWEPSSSRLLPLKCASERPSWGREAQVCLGLSLRGGLALLLAQELGVGEEEAWLKTGSWKTLFTKSGGPMRVAMDGKDSEPGGELGLVSKS